jgi:nucleoside-diphosphate-sugar epimerase
VATVLITGARSPLGRRVVDRLKGTGVTVEEVAAKARANGSGVWSTDPVANGVPTAVVHLLAGDHDALVARRVSAFDGTTEMLATADGTGATHVIVLSSAMVYGAWPNNPVPLTEEAVLRPDATFPYARQLAQVEQLVDEWRRAVPGRSVTVLRPVLALAANGTSSVVRALAAGMGHRLGEEDAPAQFLHLDDLAAAVELAVERRLDGVYNVAPDGWVAGDRVRALAGDPPKIRLPAKVADSIAVWRWRFERGPIPPGLRPYTSHPWLVANDRLKAAGWRPTVTNEQAYVEGTEAKWWTMMTPKRKQELALGAMVATAIGLAGAVAAMVRTVRRRRRRL